MSGVPGVLASSVVLDGHLRIIPGFNDGDFRGDQLPFVISSSVLTLHTAQANQDSFCVPFDYKVVYAFANLIEVPGTAAGTVNIGTRADADKFVDAYSFATDATLGWTALTLTATLTGSQGDVIEFDTAGEATTTGLAALGLIIVPYNGA